MSRSRKVAARVYLAESEAAAIAALKAYAAARLDARVALFALEDHGDRTARGKSNTRLDGQLVRVLRQVFRN